MTSAQVRDRILDIGIIPVVRAASTREVILAVEAVTAGGIPIVELTMTVPGAISVIAELVRTMGKDTMVGAGTVLDSETARRCINAGAEFIVSPGFDPATVQLVKQQDKLMMAGALTPTEVITAWKAGSDFVKIFPCGNLGGPKYIKALKGPLPQVPMIPTGGVNLETAGEFLKAGAAAVAVGSELVDAKSVKEKNYGVISARAKQYLEAIAKARAEMS